MIRHCAIPSLLQHVTKIFIDLQHQPRPVWSCGQRIEHHIHRWNEQADDSALQPGIGRVTAEVAAAQLDWPRACFEKRGRRRQQ